MTKITLILGKLFLIYLTLINTANAEIFIYENKSSNTSFYGSYKFDDVNFKIFDVNVYFGHDSFPGITTFSDENFKNIGILELHEDGFKIIFRDVTGSLTGTAIFTGKPADTVHTFKTNLINFNAGIERSFASNKGGIFTRKKTSIDN